MTTCLLFDSNLLFTHVARGVPSHLHFTDPNELGVLCAASQLDVASISSGTDHRICCPGAEGKVSFAPRGVVLGGSLDSLAAAARSQGSAACIAASGATTSSSRSRRSASARCTTRTTRFGASCFA